MAMSEAGAPAMAPPQYGVGSKCPKCGTAMKSDGHDGADCPKCGYSAPVAKAIHWDAPFDEKGADWSVKELGNGTLVIEGYASTWMKDRDGDEIVRTAFDKSLPDYLENNPVLLKDHDRTKVLGRITKAVTDDTGLRIRGEVPKPEAGEESWKFTAYNDIKRGLRRALSIGGVFTRGKDAFKTIYEVALFEISNIAVPSNPKSLFRVVEEKGLADWSYKTSTTAFSPQEETIMTEETKSDDSKVVLDKKEFEKIANDLNEFKAFRNQQAIEARAESEAKAKLEQEERDAKAAAEQDAKDAKRVAELVDAKLAAARSGRKFVVPAQGETKAGSENESVTHLLYRKSKGDAGAAEKLAEMSTKTAAEYGIKALGEGGSSGFIVPPVFWQQGIAEYRIAASKVRQLCTVIPGIATNLVYMPRETGIASVGWTAENAAKPSTDQTFGQIAVNIFTLAGISKVSRQLLEDSSPAVDTIVRKDLGRLLGQAEDIAFLAGTGTGQPTGILNTSNILGGNIGTQTVADALAAAITSIQQNYFGDPEAVLIHPVHLNLLRTAKDANNRYIFEPAFFPGNSPVNRAFLDNNNASAYATGGYSGSLGGGYGNMPSGSVPPGYGSQGGPQGTIWGLPVYADANLATPANAGKMIVAAFSECYILERTGVTLDVSSEAGTSFEQNQTWFRGEERLGFTAARQPSSIYVVSQMP